MQNAARPLRRHGPRARRRRRPALRVAADGRLRSIDVADAAVPGHRHRLQAADHHDAERRRRRRHRHREPLPGPLPLRRGAASASAPTSAPTATTPSSAACPGCRERRCRPTTSGPGRRWWWPGWPPRARRRSPASHHIDRGYDDLVGRLAAVGADIRRSDIRVFRCIGGSLRGPRTKPSDAPNTRMGQTSESASGRGRVGRVSRGGGPATGGRRRRRSGRRPGASRPTRPGGRGARPECRRRRRTLTTRASYGRRLVEWRRVTSNEATRCVNRSRRRSK